MIKWKLIGEAKTPSDMKSIEASFNKDVSDEKFSPSVDFMKAVYRKMNKEFFFNYLPMESELHFMTRNLGNSSEVGSAPYSKHREKHEVTPKAIILNNSYKLTLHGWMEAMLHEMTHILDYLLNPDSYYEKDYESHGDWFMKQGQKFSKHGFNVTKYCELGIENNDDIEVDDCMDNGKRNMFLVFSKSKEHMCVRIDANDKDRAMEFLSDQGVKKAALLSTPNPYSEEVDIWHPGESMSPVEFNSTTNVLYGPFKREGILDASNPVSESEEDELDEYMKIARTIKGVVSVERDGDEVIVTIA